MPWYVPAILVPAFVLSAWFGIRAFNELNKGADPFNVLGRATTTSHLADVDSVCGLWPSLALGFSWLSGSTSWHRPAEPS